MSEEPTSNSHIIKVDLKYPFEWAAKDGKELIKSVSFFRPKGKHIQDIINRNTDLKGLLKLAARVNTENFTPAFFGEMDAADCINVSEVMGDFLDNGQETGEIV